MLTVITDITDYQLSKNPVVLQLETDSYLVTPGVAASITIDASSDDGASTVGGTMSLIWQSDSVTFTVATTPDDSGYQVSPKGALSAGAFAVQLTTELNKNYTLSEKFTIVTSGGSIIITAREPGVEFALYDNFTSVDFGYIVNATHEDGTDPVYAENYKMRADLWMESSFHGFNYTKKGTIELDPLNDQCIFDFQTEINANLSYDLPEYGQSTITACNNLIKRFYVRFLEKYGTPVSNRELNTTAIGYVLKAGVPNEQFVGTTSLLESMFRTPGAFLTRQPRIKKVRETQQEFLYFCMPIISSHFALDPTFRLRITISKKDNTADVGVYKFLSSPYTEYQVNCIPVGFLALGLDSSVPWDNVKKYVVEVYSDIDHIIISEAFTFIPDRDYFIDEHYLWFTQSCSGVDTLRCTGLLETNIEIEKDIVQKTILFNTSATTGQYAEVSHQKTDKYKISTGWITQAQVDWLEDLFLAEQKFVERDGQLIPIVISTTAFKKYDTNTNLYSYELEYSTAIKNRVPKTLLELDEEGS